MRLPPTVITRVLVVAFFVAVFFLVVALQAVVFFFVVVLFWVVAFFFMGVFFFRVAFFLPKRSSNMLMDLVGMIDQVNGLAFLDDVPAQQAKADKDAGTYAC